MKRQRLKQIIAISLAALCTGMMIYIPEMVVYVFAFLGLYATVEAIFDAILDP